MTIYVDGPFSLFAYLDEEISQKVSRYMKSATPARIGQIHSQNEPLRPKQWPVTAVWDQFGLKRGRIGEALFAIPRNVGFPALLTNDASSMVAFAGILIFPQEK